MDPPQPNLRILKKNKPPFVDFRTLLVCGVGGSGFRV